ncbi:MAG: hypothetical protein N2510_05795 [Ignavibacteria bacterium]|nr:hypothetical protein [Ignavibacteria bacterium]
MNKKSRLIILISSLLMISAYFLPIWDISLEAPQYPEGLGMKIWINKITGDLQTINGLNHYIGMKSIEPDSIKELEIMPYVLGLIILGGLLVWFTGRKIFFRIWLIYFFCAGIAGAVDFYIWEYDYGHNLDPNAAIKVPGMSYQPPLIGSKQLLNFVAHSYPDIGGIVIISAGLISVIVFFYERGLSKKNNAKRSKSHEKVSYTDITDNHSTS